MYKDVLILGITILKIYKCSSIMGQIKILISLQWNTLKQHGILYNNKWKKASNRIIGTDWAQLCLKYA